MVCLDGTPHAGQPLETTTLEVQLLHLLEDVASGDLRATIRPAAVGHGLGMAYAHQAAHGAEPHSGKVTRIVTVDGLGRANHCEPLADHLAGNRLRYHAFIPRGYRHEVSVVAVDAEDDTVMYLLAVSAGGMANLSMATLSIGTSGTGVQLDSPT